MKKPPTRKITPPWSSSLGDNLDETPTCSRVTLSQGAATRISYVPIAISPGGSTEPACGRGRFVYRWRFARSGNWREKTTYRHDITHQLIPRPSWSEIYGSTSTVTIKEESLLEPCFHKTIHRSLLVGLPKFCVSSRFHGRNPTGMMPKILLDMDSCQWNLSPWATAQTPTAWKPDRTESMSCQRCCKTNTQRSATKCAHNMRVYIYVCVLYIYIYTYLFVYLFIFLFAHVICTHTCGYFEDNFCHFNGCWRKLCQMHNHAGGALPQKPLAENPSALTGSKIWKLADAHAHSSRGIVLCMCNPHDCNRNV